MTGPRWRVPGALAVLALLAITFLSGSVLADHTYAHRYYLEGRVVDSEGYPLGNVTVRAFIDTATPINRAGETEKDIRVYQTDCDGYYGWNVRNEGYRGETGLLHAYLHVHDPRSDGAMHVAAVNATYPLNGSTPYRNHAPLMPVFEQSVEVFDTVERGIDPVLRRSFVLLTLDVPRPDLRCEGTHDKSDRYTIMGRLMREVPRQTVEGGAVIISQPIPGATATARLVFPDGEVVSGTGTTDSDGDWRVHLPVNRSVEGANVTVTVNGKTKTYAASPLHHATFAENARPVAHFDFSTDGLTVTVAANRSTDPDGTVASYAWAFGEAAASPLKNATGTHTFAAAGTYVVTLFVKDDEGAWATTTRAVTVTAPAQPGGQDEDGQEPATQGERTPFPGLALTGLAVLAVAVALRRRR